jgi:hypothetical protein
MSTDHEVKDRFVDGNAIGGRLSALFPFDMTVATVTCDSCGKSAELATYKVFQDAPGTVVRCSLCDAVVMRFTERDDRWWLDLRGTRVLQLLIERAIQNA